MIETSRIAALGAVVAAALASHGSVAGQANAEDEDDSAATVESCLQHSLVRRTKVVDGRNIVFTTRSGQNYNNPLPRECPSLQRGSIVNYGIVGGRLCAGNSFQVMWQMGLNLVPTFVCQLGAFVPVTEAEVEDLMALTDETPEGRKKRRRSSREMVTATPIESAEADTPAAPKAEDEDRAGSSPPAND